MSSDSAQWLLRRVVMKPVESAFGAAADRVFVGGTPDQRIAAAGNSISWWGENIYKSAPGDATAQPAFTSWVNSSGHRDNMLSTNFTQIGIGRATASDGRTYWTNTFGKPA